MKHPIPDAALDDRLGFVGTAGAGKTYNAAACVERLLDSAARVVVVDPLDVWWGLRLIADGSSASRYSMPIFGGAHGDLPLTEYAGALIGETVAGMAESCIVSLGGLQTKAAERRFMLAFLDAIYRKANGEPVHLIFDEADLWAPQKSSEPMLQSRMEEICRRGRIKGLIPWLITQRPAVISKDVLSQVDGLAVFKLTSSQDRDALEGWIEGQADRAEWKAIRAKLPTMERGQGVVWIPGRNVLETAQFPLKRTFDSSRTPRRGETKRTAALKPLDLGALKERLAMVEADTKTNDPKVLRARIAELERTVKISFDDTLKATWDPAKEIGAAENRGYEAGQAAGYRHGFETARARFDNFIIDIDRHFSRLADLIADGKRTIEAANQEIKSGPSPLPLPKRQRPSPGARGGAPAVALGTISPATGGDPGLTNPQRTLLRALAWWRVMGHHEVTRAQAAVLAGWKPTGSNLKDRLSELSKFGLVEYPRTGDVRLTDAGAAAAPAPDMNVTLIESVRSILTGPQLKLFDALRSFAGEGARSIGRLALAERVGWEGGGSNLKDRLSELSGMQLVEYPHRGSVALQAWVLA